MNLLENYLDYLNEREYNLGAARDTNRTARNLFKGNIVKDATGAAVRNTTTSAGKYLVHNAKIGLRGSIWWTVLLSIAIPTVWKGLNFAFSQAYRKCGFSKGPGKQMCIARERINILQKKMIFMNKALSACGKSRDPDTCRQQGQLEIDKVKNRIESNQNKLKDLAEPTEESVNVEEQAGAAMAVAGFAAMTIAGYAADFATQKAWRSALAIFSQASRKCGVYKTGPARDQCMSQYKLISLNKQLEILNQIASKCPTQKNPEVCREKTAKKIEDTKRQMQIQKDNVMVYKRDAELEKREIEMKKAKKLASKGM